MWALYHSSHSPADRDSLEGPCLTHLASSRRAQCVQGAKAVQSSHCFSRAFSEFLAPHFPHLSSVSLIYAAWANGTRGNSGQRLCSEPVRFTIKQPPPSGRLETTTASRETTWASGGALTALHLRPRPSRSSPASTLAPAQAEAGPRPSHAPPRSWTHPARPFPDLDARFTVTGIRGHGEPGYQVQGCRCLGGWKASLHRGDRGGTPKGS